MARVAHLPECMDTFRLYSGTKATMPASHTHGDIEVGLVEEGSVTLVLGGRRYRIRAGRLHLFWAAVPHQTVEDHHLRRDYSLHIPLPWFLRAGLSDRFTRAILDGRFLVDPQAANQAADIACFRRWSKDFEKLSRERHAVMAAEVAARLSRLALEIDAHSRHAGREARSTSHGAWATVERLMRYIAENADRGLHIADIAQAAGVHPRYAMTVFGRLTSMSLNQYLTRCRIWNTQQLLLTTDRKVIDIASAAGYHTMSRFYAAFRRVTGTTPQRYRM